MKAKLLDGTDRIVEVLNSSWGIATVRFPSGYTCDYYTDKLELMDDGKDFQLDL